MPGKNANFDVAKLTLLNRIFCNNAYVWCGLVIVLVQLYGMFRFYLAWPGRCTSSECLILCLLWILFDVQIFKGLYVTHHSDPGYILPSEQLVSTGVAETFDSCPKCEVVKEHARIHHCSRCGRCVDYMDHHCTITDNCVGRGNMKYFFHFVSWAFLALVTGLGVFVHNVYGFNRETKTGLVNLTDVALLWSPISIID